jgi:VWFA-related protein
MKSSVAFFLALTTFTSGAVQGQTPPRKGSQAPATKPRNDTLKVCQGVPIPDGYVIIAYMTSTACPHGAYLLKKQNDYEGSLAVNGDARQSANPSSAGNTTPQTSKSSVPPKGGQTGRRSGSAVMSGTTSTQATINNGTAGTGSSGSTGSTGATIIRPRRVGTATQTATQSPPAMPGATQSSGVVQSPANTQSTGGGQQSQEITQTQDANETPAGPPSLIGAQASRPSAPPTLGTMGSKVANPADNSAAEPTAPTGPEEVGEGDVLRVETALVTVPVSVLDRQGRFIGNLQKDDFKVFENGVEQSIAYFEPAEKPFTVALVLDTSASTHFHLDEIREAAIAFAKQLRPQDRVLIVSFNDEVLLLTEATNDMNVIETVIEENANTGSSTRLYDAVDLTIRERLNKIKGRKAIVLFTDGVDTSSQQATYLGTLREVEELDALIYPIQYDTSDYLNAMQGVGNGTVIVTTTTRGLFGTSTQTQTYNAPVTNGGAPIPGSTKADYDRADRYLHALADKTGGRLYQANDTKQLAQAFSNIAEELRRQYSLGYYPKSDGGPVNDGRRQIRVKVRQSNLAVKARDSYTAKSASDNQKK